MTEAIKHRWSNVPHLVRNVFDGVQETWCHKWYYDGQYVIGHHEWLAVCPECRRTRASVTNKRFYETPVLRKGRAKDARLLRHELRAIEERRRWEQFTGQKAP